MIELRLCSVRDVLAPENKVLIDEYSAESSIKGMPSTDAQLQTYQLLEDAGTLQVIGAFSGTKLVGYVTVIVSVVPHYNRGVGITESFFVAKSYRGTGAGIRLLRAAEKYVVDRGAVGMLVSAPYGGSLSKVLPRTGYAHTNEVFFRRLCV